jgi:hypothetical protein
MAIIHTKTNNKGKKYISHISKSKQKNILNYKDIKPLKNNLRAIKMEEKEKIKLKIYQLNEKTNNKQPVNLEAKLEHYYKFLEVNRTGFIIGGIVLFILIVLSIFILTASHGTATNTEPVVQYKEVKTTPTPQPTPQQPVEVSQEYQGVADQLQWVLDNYWLISFAVISVWLIPMVVRAMRRNLL